MIHKVQKSAADITNLRSFWTINFIIVFIISLYFITGLNIYYAIILISVTCYSLYKNYDKKYSIYFTYLIIIIITLYPLTAILFKGGVLLRDNTIRSFFYREEYIEIAIFTILIQSSCLASFLFISNRKPLTDGRAMNIGKHIFTSRPVLISMIIILSFLSNPTSSIFLNPYGSESFDIKYLQIGGWNVFFVFLFSFYAITTKLNSRIDFIVCMVVTLFWLSYGNRSEVFFIIPLYIIFNSGPQKTLLSKKIKYAFFLVVALLIFQAVGHIRTKPDITFFDIFNVSNYKINIFRHQDRLTIPTIDATDYALLSLVGLIESKSYQLQYGKTYLDYFFRTFPSFIIKDRPVDLAVKIMHEASSIGGVHFAGEGFFNFHLPGVYFQAILVGFILLWFEKKAANNTLVLVTYFSLFILSARVVLYGNIYLYKSLVLFVILIIISFFLKSARSYRHLH